MPNFKWAKPILVALTFSAVICTFGGKAFADDDKDKQQLKDQLRVMQQQMQEMQKQIEALSKKVAAPPAAPPAAAPSPAPAGAGPSVPTAAKEAPPAEPKFEKFLKGFYGTLDVSIDYTTKGETGMVAYPWNYANGMPGSPYVITGGAKAGPYGNVGWLPMMSSNGSSIGYRGSHKIGSSDVDFIYQVSTAINMVAAPGLQNTWTKSSNTVQGAIGLGDTFVGFQDKSWGRVRFGEMFLPYKVSTDRLNPFGSGLGNYAVVMGNTGGDNRVEFGTRSDHVMAYSSPTWGGLSFDAAFAFGQQIDPNSDLTPLGSAGLFGIE